MTTRISKAPRSTRSTRGSRAAKACVLFILDAAQGNGATPATIAAVARDPETGGLTAEQSERAIDALVASGLAREQDGRVYHREWYVERPAPPEPCPERPTETGGELAPVLQIRTRANALFLARNDLLALLAEAPTAARVATWRGRFESARLTLQEAWTDASKRWTVAPGNHEPYGQRELDAAWARLRALAPAPANVVDLSAYRARRAS